MKISLVTCLSITFGFLVSVIAATSDSPRKAQGPEPDSLEFSASGSGDAEDEIDSSDNDHKQGSNDKGHPDLTFDRSKWPTVDSDFIILPNRERFLDNKDTFTAVVAGAVVGATLALTLAIFLILKWQKMDTYGVQRRRSETEKFLKTKA